jgi:uncharacterized protein (DUF58 family)
MSGLIPGRDGIEAFLTAQERHKLSRMVLLSRHVVEGNLAGAHRSPLRGLSSEFADHKQYGMGDDPKHIDWRVVARSEKYYVKRFEDETNLRVYLVLDRSGSMQYGSGTVSKYVFAARLAAALGYVVVKARDSIGLFLHGEKLDITLPARNSVQHLNDLLRQVQAHPPGGNSAIAETLHTVASSVRRRALVVVISDLLGDEEAIKLALSRLRKQHHDVIVFQTLDPTELDLDMKKPRLFEDLETGERLQAHPRDIAAAYRQVFGAFIEQYRLHCAAMNIDFRLVRSDQPLDTFARAYLLERRRYTA